MPEGSGKKVKERQPVYALTRELYQRVIDDTCSRMKSEFVERGISEDILKQLRALWESNVSKTGAIGEYLGAKGGEAAVQLTPEGVASAQPSQQLLTGTKRPLEPSSENGRPGKLAGNLAVIPQQDGTLDSENDDEDEEEEELLGSDLDDSEIDELNEDDDLADVDNLDKIDESKVKNVVLGQFERVHRSKNRWKVNLKGCIANINGKDYLFKKLTGEMDFS